MSSRKLQSGPWIVGLILCLVSLSASGSGTEYYPPEPQAARFNHSHARWDDLLAKVLRKGTEGSELKLDLSSLKDNRKLLESYIESIRSVAQSDLDGFSTNEQTAFLVNAFNAFSLKENLDAAEGEPKTLGPNKTIFAFGDVMSVASFMERFLKRRIQDPRAFLALHCFDPGCPSLYGQALNPEKLEGELGHITSSFLSDKAKNHFDKAQGKIVLSPIFKRYQGEFAKKYGSLGAFAGKHLISNPILLMKARSGALMVEFK